MQSDENNTNLVLQLESIYSTLNFNTKDDNSTLNSPSFDQLDYGQKLVANHNILKDLILVVDNKIAGRQTKKSELAQRKQESQKRSKANDGLKNEQKRKEGDETQPIQSRLREKMLVVREKLKEIIQYINSEAKSDRKLSRKDVNLQQIKEISSQYEPSLQYSRDQSSLLEVSKEKITIDKSKLQNAKEVVSHEFLHPDKNQLSNRSYTQPKSYMKSSLERISEVQSGQNMTEKDTEQGHPSKGHSRMNSKEVTAKNSLQFIEQEQELDETGKIILSTINKKTTSTTTLQRQKSDPPPSPPLESQVINQASSSIEADNLGSGIKKNKFWLKNITNPIQHYSKNTVVSHQQLEDSKVIEKITKNNLKAGPLKSFKNQDKSTLHPKSIEKLPQSTNHRSPSKPSVVNISAIEIQSSQMIPLSNNTYLSEKDETGNQNSIIYKKQIYAGPQMGVMRLQRQPSFPNVRQSRILQEYQQQPNIIWRPISIHRQEQQTQPQIQTKYNPQNRVQPIRFQPEMVKPPINLHKGINFQSMQQAQHRSRSPPPRPSSPNNYIELRKQNSEIINNKGLPIGYYRVQNVPGLRPSNPQSIFITQSPTLGARLNLETPKQSIKPHSYPQPAMPPKPYRPAQSNATSQANQRMMHKYKPSLDQIIQTSQHSYANSVHRQSINNSRVTAMDSRSNRGIAQSRASRSGSKRKGIQLTTVFPAS